MSWREVLIWGLDPNNKEISLTMIRLDFMGAWPLYHMEAKGHAGAFQQIARPDALAPRQGPHFKGCFMYAHATGTICVVGMSWHGMRQICNRVASISFQDPTHRPDTAALLSLLVCFDEAEVSPSGAPELQGLRLRNDHSACFYVVLAFRL